jgi:hypothetical protein
MKRVISFSLWGGDPKYNIGSIENAKLRQDIYGNDWECWFYLGSSVPHETIEILSQIPQTTIIKMPTHGDWSGMFWRFLPAFDENVDIMVSRDTDSRLSKREKLAVDEWISSDKDFHIMRDHPFHNTAILGGMWGARNNIMNRLNIVMSVPENSNFWQVDQNFLREYVYPSVRNNSFVHDSYNLFDDPQAKKFPSERINNGFVGEIYDENNHRHPDHYTLL